jgi:V8-like Glu-specific endopeptidase
MPHRHIGVVLAHHQMGAIQLGTGILISPNLVLTCAHVIHSKIYQNKPFPRIYFLPAQYGELKNFYEIEQAETPEEYRSEEKWLYKKAYDYTLLKLKVSVEESGFLPLSEDLPQFDKETTLAIFGYPESKYDKKGGKPKATRQYGLTRTGYILDVYAEAGYMVHRISAEAGQSGAPVISIDSNGKMTIVGLHVGTPEEQTDKYSEEFPDLKKANLAKLINKLMVNRLKEFAKKLNGEMFGVCKVEESEVSKVFEEKKKLEEEKAELLRKLQRMEEKAAQKAVEGKVKQPPTEQK